MPPPFTIEPAGECTSPDSPTGLHTPRAEEVTTAERLVLIDVGGQTGFGLQFFLWRCRDCRAALMGVTSPWDVAGRSLTTTAMYQITGAELTDSPENLPQDATPGGSPARPAAGGVLIAEGEPAIPVGELVVIDRPKVVDGVLVVPGG